MTTPAVCAVAVLNRGRVPIAWDLTCLSRKQQMMIQSRELQALQERIREAEERLKRQSVYGSSSVQGRGGEAQTAGKDGST